MPQGNKTGRKAGAPAARSGGAPPAPKPKESPVTAGGSVRVASTLHFAGQVRAESRNDEDRTVEVIWAAGAAVRRYSWEDGPYMEELGMEPENIRLERFSSGMSLLDGHDTYTGMDARLGTVVPASVRIEGGKAYCTVKISRNARGEALWQDLVDGHPFPVSVGYQTHAYEKIEGTDGQIPVLRAIDWEPHEISAVPVPADGGAHSRSETNIHPIDVSITSRPDSRKNDPMPTQNNRTGRKPGEENNPGQAAGEGEGNDDDDGTDGADGANGEGGENGGAGEDGEHIADGERGTRPAGSRQAPVAPQTRAASPAPALDQAEVAASVQRALVAERARTVEIQTIATRGGLSQTFVQQHLNSGSTAAQVRAAAFDELARIQAETGAFPHVETRGLVDATDTRRAAIGNALLHANGVIPDADLTAAGREYRGMTSMDIAKECIAAAGLPTRGNPNQIAERAFHTTSDFPVILGNIADTTLMNGYETVRAENTFQLFASRNVLPDFRDASVFELGSAPDLLPVNEHGEFKRGTMRESGERFALGTFGRIIGMTRQMLINDQLGAFMKAVNNWGGKVAKLEGDVVWNIIINNAMLKDGVGIFDTTRGNVAATGTALNSQTVLAGRKAMRKFKDIDGEQISIKPTYLFVGTENEVPAQQLVAAQYAPTTGVDVTPVAIKSLIPVYEPRLDLVGDYAWFLFATAADAAGRGVQYAYLNGQEAPFTDNRVGFDVDGMEFKIRHDFGAGVTDWRSGYKNPGAAPA